MGKQIHSIVQAASLRPAARPAVWLVLALLCAGTAVGSTDYAALAQQVEIRRDEYGVPHITGPTEEAVAFAQGYAQAEDYPESMPRVFLMARGEAAKYFGVDYAEGDMKMKIIRLYEDSVERFPELPPNVQGMLNGFAAGYNLWLEAYGDRQPWMLPADGPTILATARKLIAIDFGLPLDQYDQIPEIVKARTACLDNGQQETLTPGASSFAATARGSNGWAIGKTRSASGRGILLANPHVSWEFPSLFHEAHLTVPGVMNVMGATFVGIPGIGVGFNENLGWTHTNSELDLADILELETDPANPDCYLYDGVSMPLEKRSLVVEVHTDGGLRQEQHTAYYTHFGPVIREYQGKRYALKAQNLDDIVMVEQWNRMAKARNLNEFKDALRVQGLTLFNVLYADREGNCYYTLSVRMPVREKGYSWGGIVPGNTWRTDWRRLYSPAEMPQALNPESGFVQNCNESPYFATGNRSDMPRMPHIFDSDIGPRTQRSYAMLSGDKSITLEEVKAYKFDTTCAEATALRPDLLRLLRNQGVATNKQALDVLEHWDGTLDAQALGAVLFMAWYDLYREDANPLFRQGWQDTNPYIIGEGIGDETAALGAMDRAVKTLIERYGRLDVPWGEVHRLRRGKLDLPLSGGPETFRCIDYAPLPEETARIPGQKAANMGDCYVLAVEFNDSPKAFSIMAYGQTERKDSPHHVDQTKLFARNEFKRAYFTEEDVRAHTQLLYHPGERHE
ncbi:MAG: hypothetical protein GWP08_12270 [Nitrospiraceae bacterium]|nr:hypothetical protein [Nitrospiraceae bacterium]